MHYVAVVVLALLGAAQFGAAGFLFGGLLGLNLAWALKQRREIESLKQRLESLDPGLASAAPGSPPAESSGPVAGSGSVEAEAETPAPVPEATPEDPGWERSRANPADASTADWRERPGGDSGVFGARLRALFERAKRFFTTGNLVVRVGVLVLFFGVAFLLRYAYENSIVPVQVRLIGTALGGLVLAFLGWRLRHRSDTYGLVLQGAGVGLLYLTIFAAARLYSLIPLTGALVALVVLVSASSVLAVVQRSQALAIFAMSGGFLAPVLVSTGQGSHVALFSFYALLNTGILAMAWFCQWRWLNWIGFVFTFVIGGLWGYQYYEPRYFGTTQPFLVLFFLYYVAVSVLFARRNPVDLRGVIDGTLVFGTPVVAFAMQAALVADIRFGLAFSALGAAVTYVLLALWLKRQGAFVTLLGQSFLALGVAFATLAIPFAFDDQRYTAATWALEGAGLVWVGLRQHQLLPRLAGLALQGGAALAFLADWQRASDATLFANSAFFGAAMITAGAGFSGFLLNRAADNVRRLERAIGLPLVFWAVLWWLGGGAREVAETQSADYPAGHPGVISEHLFVLFAAASFGVLIAVARRLDWRAGLAPGFLALPLAVMVGVGVGFQADSPLQDLGWLAWPAALGVSGWHLRQIEDGRLGAVWHTFWWWWIAFLLAWVSFAFVDAVLPGSVWAGTLWGLVPGLVAALLVGTRLRPTPPDRWPLGQWQQSYFGWGMAGMMLYLLAWVYGTGMFEASPAPLPYVVLLNPLELVQVGVLVVAVLWTRVLPPSALAERVNPIRAAIALTGFVWLNQAAARAVHAYGGVGYPIERIMDSDLFQTTASILWTCAAVLLMSLGARRRLRISWIAGAGLLALVIAKLFLLDLANLGTIARIVSFVSVGLLMLVIGYLAPLPPTEPPTEPPTDEPTEDEGAPT